MASLEKSLTAIFDDRADTTEGVSISMAVLHDAELTELSFGSSENVVFQAASISKPVAATAALRLVADGIIDLDDDVNDHLTSWQIPSPYGQPMRITLRQLLSHSAALTVHGFPGYARDAALPTLPQILNGESPSNTGPVRPDGLPGLAFRYSGGGYTVLQVLLEDLTGRPFVDLATELVLDPAGMTTATYRQPESGQTAGYLDGVQVRGGWHVYPEQAAAGLWCTAADLVRFVAAIRDSANGTHALLPGDIATEMLTVQAAPLGLGFFLEDDPVLPRFGHTGGNYGYQCVVTASRTTGHAVAVMTNSDAAMPTVQSLLDTAMDATDWPRTPKPEPKGPSPVRSVQEWVDRYCGRYRLADGRIVTIDFQDDGEGSSNGLISLDGQPPLTLDQIDATLCAVLAVPNDILFDLDDRGFATALTLRQRGEEFPAARE